MTPNLAQPFTSLVAQRLQSVGIVGMISFEWLSELAWLFDAMILGTL